MTDQERIADLEKQVEELTRLLHEALTQASPVYVFPPLPAGIIQPQPLHPIQPWQPSPYITCNGQGLATDGIARLAPII